LELYSQILELEVWEQASENATKAVRAIGAELTDAEHDIATLEGREQELKRFAEHATERCDEWEAKQKTRTDLGKKNVQLLEKALALIPASYTDRDLMRARKEEKDARGAMSLSEREVLRVQTEIATLTRSVDLAKRGTCPTCGQRMPKDGAHSHVKDIEARTKLLAGLEKKHEKTVNAFNSATRNVRSLEGTLEARAAKEKEIEEAKKGLRTMEQENNPYQEQRIGVGKELVRVRLAMHEGHKAVRKIKTLEQRYAFWVKGFRDLRLWLVQESLTQLELEVNSVLQDLGLDGWQMQFDVEKENKSGGIKRGFTVLVLSPQNETAVPWEVWSGGEAQRLRIAAMMGVSNLILAQRGTPYSVEFYDEPSTWLTEEGVDALLRLLEQRAQSTGRAIFIADHRALQFGGFSETVRVAKGAKGSSIIERTK
jgi:DNA repair exonuclease SbcCD ATPase subunit